MELRMSRSRLQDLAFKYSSDKLFRHSYIPAYERLFDGMHVEKVLEIGVGYEQLMKPFLPDHVPFVRGSSLRMWSEYWPDADIYACDVHVSALVNEGRIRSYYADQSKREDLQQLMLKCDAYRQAFDVIIDDGSHRHKDQVVSARELLSFVRPGGVYVIEDVWADKGRELAMMFGGELVEGSRTGDDNLVVIRK